MKDDRRDDVIRGDGDANRDPLSGAPGAHPIGTGIGAAGAGAVGAAIGAVAGPVGSLAGAAIGAVVGGLAGKGVAEAIDPTAEDAYWRENYRNRPYVESGTTYDEYQPAYRYGWESRARHHDRKFDDVERDLGREWDKVKGGSRLTWEKAKHATRDAFHRFDSHQTGTTGASVASRGATMGDTVGSAGMGTGRTLDSGMTSDYDDDYFRRSYTTRPYYETGKAYDEYEPAYRFGHSLRSRYTGRNWNDIETDVSSDWDAHRGRSSLTWERAKHAVKDAFERMGDKVDNAVHGTHTAR
jgi:hypothetical protein